MDIQLLTVEEFAKKMKVARTTVFQWLKDEKLIQGKHYIRIGRVVRFQWPSVVIQLQEDNTPTERSVAVAAPKRKSLRHKTTAIDLQYD